MDTRAALRRARKNERVKRVQAETEAERHNRADLAQRRQHQQEIEEQIRLILPLLERADHPDVEVVKCHRRSKSPFTQGIKHFERPGWMIFSRRVSMNDQAESTGIEAVYLLADGRLAVSGAAFSIPEFIGKATYKPSTEWQCMNSSGLRPHIIAGLASLRKKLESGQA